MQLGRAEKVIRLPSFTETSAGVIRTEVSGLELPEAGVTVRLARVDRVVPL